jgi:hypothetical protein
MNVTKAAYAKLTGTPDINTPTAGHIYPIRVPQSVTHFPRMVYAVENEERDSTYDGDSGFAKATLTVLAICQTPASADQMSKALKDALNDDDGEWAGVTIHGCFLESDDAYEQSEPETTRTLYFVEQKYRLVFNNEGDDQ